MSRKALFLSIALLVAGCGPIQATTSILRAEKALDACRFAEVESVSLYEYTAGVMYLDQARVLEGRAEYQQARDFADRSAELATQAKNKKGENALRRKAVETARKAPVKATEGGAK